jgi:DNA polymerase I-like protein with 3'-5' exonuclease and polymerase domains
MSEEEIRNSPKDVQWMLDNHKVIFHHAAFDIWVLESFGFYINEFHDTMLMSYCINPSGEHSLRALGGSLECEVTKTEFSDFSKYSEEMALYCRNDCRSTWEIFSKLASQITSDTRLRDLYTNIEIPFVRELISLRNNGVFIDKSNWEGIIKEVEAKQGELLSQIMRLFPLVPGKLVKTKNPRSADTICDENNLELGKYVFIDTEDKDGKAVYNYKKVERFNPGSSDQLAYAFTKLYGWEPKKFSPKTGKPTVDSDVVESLDNPLATLIVKYAELAKLTSTYGTSLLELISEDGRLRATFNPTTTLTGRLSCSKPNLQNIPSNGEYGSQLRNLFVASPGKVLVGCDVDAFQMRILAWYLNNVCKTPDSKVLFNDFNNNPNPDPHQTKADLLGVTRKEGKTLNFGILFGMGVNKLANQLGISAKDAKLLLMKDAKKNPSVNLLRNMVVGRCKAREGYIYTMYGRRGYYPDILSSDKGKQSHAERQAFNFIIQGTEADIIKQWTIKVSKVINDEWLNAKLILQVHDELLWEVSPEDADRLMIVVQDALQNSEFLPGLKVTGTPKKGLSWGEIH